MEKDIIKLQLEEIAELWVEEKEIVDQHEIDSYAKDYLDTLDLNNIKKGQYWSHYRSRCNGN